MYIYIFLYSFIRKNDYNSTIGGVNFYIGLGLTVLPKSA